MANLPFGMKLTEGAPMSELTRRVIVNLLKTKKVWADRAGNKDSFFNASNIKPTAHDPSNSTAAHNLPMDNSEHYYPAHEDPEYQPNPFRDGGGHKKSGTVQEGEHGIGMYDKKKIKQASIDNAQHIEDMSDFVKSKTAFIRGLIKKAKSIGSNSKKKPVQEGMIDKLLNRNKSTEKPDPSGMDSDGMNHEMSSQAKRDLGKRRTADASKPANGNLVKKPVNEGVLDRIGYKARKISGVQLARVEKKTNQALDKHIDKVKEKGGSPWDKGYNSTKEGDRHRDLNARMMHVKYGIKQNLVPKKSYLSGEGK